MADISKITLPSGNTYYIKDETAREMISGGISFIVAWNGSSAPTVANIPAGVTVTYNDTTYTGTLAAADAQSGAFYLVKSSTQEGTLDVYDEYVVVGGETKSWEKLGDTQMDLSDLGDLAYKDSVTLSKGSGDQVLGEATTFTAAASSVTFTGGSTDTFVKSVSAETNKKLVTTTIPNVTGNTDVSIPNVTGNTSVTIPNVTSAGSASTWSFAMGSGTDAETLIISGANGSAPTLGTALSASKVTLGTALSASKVTLGTAITAATGATATDGGGDAIVTGVTIGSSASAVTSIGTGTAAAQTITVGTNDKVKVAKYDDLSVSAS